MGKTFTFGIGALRKDYIKVKKAIQCPHMNKQLKRSTVNAASAWASAKWGKNVDYMLLVRSLGIEIIED